MVPKRADELIDGGSLFWVIRGQIICRERILDIRPFTDRDGIGRCRLVLDRKVRAGRAAPAAAFQGWRYLRPRTRRATCRAQRRARQDAGADAARIARAGVAVAVGLIA